MEPESPLVGVLGMDGLTSVSLGSEATCSDPVVTSAGGSADAATELTGDTVSIGAFVAFYGAKRDLVARGLALTLGDASLGAEAADEAMARAFQRWGRVGSFDDPAAWVYRVGLNWATSVLRRRRRAPHPLFERETGDLGPVAEPSVHAALAALDIRQRSVIVCRFYLGLSELETAKALGTRPGTVKSRLHRGLRSLQATLEHLRPEESR